MIFIKLLEGFTFAHLCADFELYLFYSFETV